MKRFLAAVAVLGIVFVNPAFAQTSGAGESAVAMDAANSELVQEIRALEKKRIAAMVSKDLEVLDALLGDDLSYIHSGGSTDTKASHLALIRDRGRYAGVDFLESTEFIPLSNDTVVVRGVAQIRLEGRDGYPVLFLDVWARRDGSWKMVAWQATRARE